MCSRCQHGKNQIVSESEVYEEMEQSWWKRLPPTLLLGPRWVPTKYARMYLKVYLRVCAHMRVSGGGAERERGSQAGSTLSAEPDVGVRPVKREIETGAEIKSGRSTD